MWLITGASGRVGRAVVEQLRGKATLRLASRGPREDASGPGVSSVQFDVLDPATFEAALEGVDSVFLMRPPQVASGKKFRPFLDACAAHQVRRMVVLSVKGADDNRILPHHGMEQEVFRRGFSTTVLRPSDFMQNLETVHREGIVARDEIAVPAGRGRSAFIDVEDIGQAAARVMLEPGHEGKGYSLTGAEALSFTEVAAVLSEVLGRPIRYRAPSMLRFVLDQRSGGLPLGMALVMTALYTVQRFGGAEDVSRQLEELLGRPPTRFRSYVERNASVFARE